MLPGSGLSRPWMALGRQIKVKKNTKSARGTSLSLSEVSPKLPTIRGFILCQTLISD
jgi:hypothetical protein